LGNYRLIIIIKFLNPTIMEPSIQELDRQHVPEHESVLGIPTPSSMAPTQRPHALIVVCGDSGGSIVSFDVDFQMGWEVSVALYSTVASEKNLRVDFFRLVYIILFNISSDMNN
jgi:hypothetical protein